MVAEAQHRRVPLAARGWRAFRDWRRARPFWGGLLLVLSGAEMFASGMAPLHVIVHLGLEGLAGQVIPILIAVCGLLVTFSPAQRPFYAIVSMLLCVGSWITSNLGGFIVGLLLGLVGASLVFAWAPPRKPSSETVSEPGQAAG
jgi:hypothetical protein